jgi:dephospho-CoA kinase
MDKTRVIIYLTGGIATGKSTVAKIFSELGAYVIDADKIAHKVIMKGTRAYNKIVEIFGKDILDETGEIDRKKLGKIVFKDKNLLAKLEEITHPEVLSYMSQELADLKSDIVIIEIPLIFEKKLELHPNVLVYAPRHIQKKRLIERDNISEEEAEMRISAQMDIEEKKKLADYVIDNSGSIEETKRQVKEILERIIFSMHQQKEKSG